MRGLEFPIIGAKVEGLKKKFDLSSPEGRKSYFEAKVGDEIAHIKKYLEGNSFIAYFLGKKNSGKGTYSKLFCEIFSSKGRSASGGGEERIAHVSVGDVVREVHRNWKEFSKSPKYAELKSLYRGYISFDEAVGSLLGRNTETLLPTEFILALLKVYIADLQGKTIFLDGLPRELDQISYSLYFRDLIDYRDDPDIFVLIDIPEAVIDERIKYRVVCPKCQTSRSIKLLITSKIGYVPRRSSAKAGDEKRGEFFLICDNPACPGVRMVAKEGDHLGIEPFRPRLMKDEEILKTAFSLHGIPKILLRNHVPVAEAKKYFDDYELTPEYSFEWDASAKKVRVIEKQWTVKDDNGVESYSLLAPAVMVSMIKQLVEALGL